MNSIRSNFFLPFFSLLLLFPAVVFATIPTTSNSQVTLDEDQVETFLETDFPITDTDGDLLSAVRIIALPATGLLQVNGGNVLLNQIIQLSDITNGDLKYYPVANGFGTPYTTFQFSVIDSNSEESAGATMTVNVNPQNDPPSAANNSLSLNEDNSITLTAADFTFSDLDGHTFSKIRIESSVALGSLKNGVTVLSAGSEVSIANINGGSLVFTPALNGNGTPYTSFTFRVFDSSGESSTVHTISFDVLSVNDLPTSNNANVTVQEDNIRTFLAGDFPFIDADGGVFTKIRVSNLAITGTLLFNAAAVSENQEILTANLGNLVFTPVANQNGNNYASFSFEVHDGDDYSAAKYTFTINVAAVNDPPTIDPVPDPSSIFEDASLQTINLTGISAGPNEVPAPTVTVSSTNSSLINPSISYNSGTGTGTVTYTPAANQYGTATITVTVNDGSLSVNESWPVTVLSVNDAPTINAIPDQVMQEDQPLVVSITGISAGPNESGQFITISAASSNTAIVSNGVVDFVPGSPSGTITFTPVSNASGTVTITVLLHDDGGDLNPGDVDSKSISFQLQVQPANDSPTLDDITDPGAISEDAPLQSVGITGITDGDTDLNQTLSVSAVSSNTALVETFTISYTSPATFGTISYTPKPNAYGSALVSVTVSDGDRQVVKSFNVVVNPVNDDPTIDPIGVVAPISEDAPEQTIVLSGITAGPNESGQTVTVSTSSSQPAVIPDPSVIYNSALQQWSIRYKPNADQYGSVIITVTVTDNDPNQKSASTSFTQEVQPLNDPPLIQTIGNLAINEDAGLQTVVFTGVSDDGEPPLNLTVTAVSGNTSLIPNPMVNYTSPNSTGSIQFTPVANAFGVASVTVRVTDKDGAFKETSFTVTIANSNDPPTLTDIPTPAAIMEDAGLQTILLSGISAGPGGELETITATAISDNTSLINNPTASITGNTGTLTYAPLANANGSAVLTVRINDGQASNNVIEKSVTVAVLAVNDAPLFTILGDQAASENSGLQTVTGFVQNIDDGDIEVQSLTFQTDVMSTTGNLVFESSPDINLATGNLTYKAAANTNGNASIKVTLRDNGGTANGGVNMTEKTFTIFITAVNDPPTFTLNGNPPSTNEDAGGISVSNFAQNMNDGDPELTQALEFVVSQISGTLTFVSAPAIDPVTGTLTYQAESNKNGTATFNLILEETVSKKPSLPQNFTITVNPVNDPPVGANGLVSLAEDTQYTFSSGNFTFSDIDLHAFQGIQVVSLPVKGTLQYNGTAISAGAVCPSVTQLVYIPLPNDAGVGYSSFLFRVRDESGDLSVANYTMQIDVIAAPDNPTGASNSINTLENVNYVFSSVDFPYSDPDSEAFGGIVIHTNVTAGSLLENAVVISTFPKTVTDVTKLVFQPVAGQSGSPYTSFKFDVRDAGGAVSGGAGTYTMSVNVGAVNDPPVGGDKTVSILEDIPFTFKVTDFPFSDADLHTFSGIQVTEIPTAGGLTYNSLPVSVLDVCADVTKLVYTPPLNLIGSPVGSFKFKVRDNSTELNTSTSSYTFAFNASAVNDAPLFTVTGNPPAINEDEGPQAIAGFATGINDGDPETSQTLTFTVTADTHPTLTFSAVPSINSTTGALTYTPAANAYGAVIVRVRLGDNGGTANGGLNQSPEQQFTLTVNPINDLPTLVDIASPLNINEDAAPFNVNLSGIGPGANETQTLNIQAASSNPSVIPNPVVNYTSPNSTGTITLSPVADASGSVTIFVTVSDGQASNNAVTKSFLVNVASVNDPPTLDAIANPPSLPEDAGVQSISLSGITAGGNESQPLEILVSSSNTTLIPAPVVSYTSPDNIGSISFTPSPNQSGTSNVTVTVRDNGSTNNTFSRIFTVTVQAVNDPPTLNDLPAAPIVINEDAPIQSLVLTGITAGGGESQTLTITAISDFPDIIANPTIGTISGGQATLSYQPVANKSGNVTITVTVNDGGATNNTISKSFVVNVVSVNDPPTLAAITGSPFSITEDASTQSVNLSGISAGPGETQTLSITASSTNTAIIPNPSISYTQGSSTAVLSYTPVPDRSGSVTITVIVDDLSASNNQATRTFVVNVQELNDFPTINDVVSTVTVAEDAPQQSVSLTGITAGANETQTVTVTAISLNTAVVGNPVVNYSGNNNATLLFTPVPNANGTAVIEISVNDGQPINNITKKSFTVEVQKVNDPPTLDVIASPVSLNEDAGLQTVLLSGITPGPNEGEQSVTVTAVSDNTALIPNPVIVPKTATTRDLTFTPVANRNGTANITVTVSDGQPTNNTVARTFSVNVLAVNDPPLFSLKGDVSTAENAGPVTVLAQATGIDDGDSDVSQALSFELVVSGTVTFSTPPTISEVTGNLTFETTANSNGTADVTVRLRDNGVPSAMTEKTFRITVLAVNGKPTFALNGNPPTINEDAGLQSIAGYASAINDGDPELSQTLTFTLTKVSGDLTFKTNPAINSTNGLLTYETAQNAFGTATIAVTLNDSGGEASAPQYFTLTVNPTNDPPLGANQIVATSEDLPYSFKSADFNAYNDAEGHAFSGIQITALESGGDLEYNGTDVALNQDCPNVSLLVFKPEPNFYGSAEFSFRLRDSQGALSPAYKMTINISSAEDSPTSGPGEVNTNENVTYTFSKSDFPFSDPDPGDDLTAVRIFTIETRGDLEYNGVDVVVGTEVTNFALLKFIPVSAENGSPYATFRFQVKDKSGNLSSDYMMSVNVGSVNDRPTGENGAITIFEDVAYTFKITDFKFEDLDGHLFDGIRIETQATAGKLEYDGVEITNLPSLCPDVTRLVFIPGADDNGVNLATFTFKVKDNSSTLNLSSANYTMTVNVTAVNDAPIFTLTGNPPTVNEDAGFQTIAGYAASVNDGDPEVVQTLQFSTPVKVSGTGNLSFQVQPKIDNNGSLTYHPTANSYGTSVFNVYLTDNGGTTNGGVNQSATQSFTITVNQVNDAPTINTVADRPPVAEDASTITINLSNITAGPLEDQQITVTAVSSNTALIPNPTVTYTSPSTTGTIAYKPNADKSGTATISVTVGDGQPQNGSTIISFVVTVTAVNDPPTIDDIPNPAPVQENSTEQLVNVTGISAGGGEVQDLVVSASSGNTTLIPNPVTINYSGGTTAQIRYKPAINQNGESTITVTVNDQSGGVTQKSFKVVVSPTNDPPTLDPISDPAPMQEDAGIIQIALTGISAGINENQTLSLSGASGNTSLIQITPASFVYTSPSSTGTLRIQPLPNQFGTTIITVSVSDGISSVSQQFGVQVNPNADSPIVTNASTNQGEQTTSGLVISRHAADGPEVTYFKITSILNGKLFLQDGTTQIINGEFITATQGQAGLRFTPTAAVDGSFEAQASLSNVDAGLGGSKVKATIFLNTTPTTTNIPDQVVNEDGPRLTFDLYQAFSDKEDPDASLKFTVANSSSSLVKATVTGQFLYVDLLPNQSGIAFITITCTDTKGAFVEDNINITINTVNDKPTFTSTPITTVNQNATYTYLVTTVDLENNQRTIIAAAPTWLAMFDNGDGTATLTGIPDQAHVGTHQVEITVKETLSGLTEKQIFTLTVANVNDPPQIISTPPTEVNVSDLYLYEIIVEDSDPGQTYTMQIDPVTRPKWLVLSEKAPYTLEGYPPEGSEGTYTIKLTAIDAGGLTGTQEYQLTVMPKNQRPALGRIDALLILENQTYSFTVQMFEDQFNDPDPDDQMEFITITELPINGKLMLDGSVVSLNDTILTADLGKLVYEPNSYYTGLDYFFWNASDGEAMSLNTSIVNISINPVSDPPEILNMETEAAIFYYGEQALALTEEAEVYEYDNGLIAFASIAITGNYNNSQDSLYLPAYDGIVSNWNDTTGVLIISGIKSDAEYQDMLRAVRYVNSKRYTPDSKKRTITIVVSDGGIESVPVSRDITFEDTFVSLDVPTGFTPNGDGANDTWEIGNIDVHEDAIVRVFTRDGIRVYESIGYFKPWDGVYNGSVLKPGVYYFTIEVKKYERRFSGTITLLR